MGKKKKSLLRSVALGLCGVGVLGIALILYSVMREYGFSFGDILSANSESVQDELLIHVGFPALIIVIPMVCAGFLVVWLALVPLRKVAQEVERSVGQERGFRVSTENLPREVAPFVGAVNALLERLDQSARLHENFAANVAHELRDPLSVLALELDRGKETEVGNLRELVASMQRLIEQLMLLARIESAKSANLEMAPLVLSDVATQVISQLAPAAISAGKSIELATSEPVPTVNGHREAIGAALRNLIENALRVTPVGAVVTVFVGPGAKMEVQDAGPGVDGDRLKLLTKRYVRSDNASHGGAGLGLAIVDQIMKVHGGALKTNSTERKLYLEFLASS